MNADADIYVMVEPGVPSPVWLHGVPVPPEEIGLSGATAARARQWVELGVADRGEPLATGGPEMNGLPHEEQVALLGAWVANRVKDAAPWARVVHFPVGNPAAPRPSPVVVADREERPASLVRVFPEWSVDLPVWGEYVTEDGIGVLPADLEARLVAWNEEWQARADDGSPGRGDWSGSAAAERDHAARGRLLAAELADLLGPDYEVVTS